MTLGIWIASWSRANRPFRFASHLCRTVLILDCVAPFPEHNESQRENGIKVPTSTMTARAAERVEMSSHSSSRSLLDDSSGREVLEIPSLDLHGLTRDVAIRRVTDFLEQHHATKANWVCIVTGTGSHSVQGPVLRSEVQRLLERRQIEFSKHSTGSFLVNASTGITFYAPDQPTDTKVMVQERPDEDATGRMVQEFMRNTKAGKVSMALPVPLNAHAQASAADTTESTRQFPSLQEVQREQDDFAKAQHESLAAFKVQSTQDSQEQSAIQAAMAMSKEQIEKERQEEEAAVLKALEESKRLAELQLKEELELMKKVLEESKRESELERKHESVILHKALEESKRQAEIEQKQEKECLDQAIEESRRQLEMEEEQLRLALDESKRLAQKFPQDEDLLIQHALEESKKLAKADEEGEVLMQQVLEASKQQQHFVDAKEQELLMQALKQSERLAQQALLSDEELIKHIMAKSLDDN